MPRMQSLGFGKCVTQHSGHSQNFNPAGIIVAAHTQRSFDQLELAKVSEVG
jgi:hypothetical protein